MGSIEEFLARSQLFKGLNRIELAKIAELCQEKEYPSGAAIFSEGEEAKNLWLVKQGRVALQMEINLGRTAALKHATIDALGEGEGFGWSALVPPHIFTASAFCLEPCKLIQIDGPGLCRLMNRNHRIGHIITNHISELISLRLREVRQTLAYSIGIVGHDLMSPLNAIESYLMVMLDGFAGETTEKQKLMLQRCIARTNEVVALIRNLLDTSRFETEELEQSFTKVYLPEVVAEAIKEVQASAKEKSIKIKINFEPELPEISGAPAQLKRVFSNLLNNSIKFTPDGGRIIVSLKKENEHILAEVSDTGIGIPQEEIPRVFDVYYRGKNVTSPGAGLGLSIAKKIVEMHKGKIWIESPPKNGKISQGCKVAFTLPR